MQRVTFDEALVVQAPGQDFVALDDALNALARSPKSESLGLAMSDALTIASQIAEALELSSLGGVNPRIGFKQQYDVAKDGRFLLNLPVEPVTEGSFTVVVNWQAAPGERERR